MAVPEPRRLLPSPLTKRWFVLRHGRSEANEAGIVASQLAHAETRYDLVAAGREEVAASVRAAADAVNEAPPLLILASPFLRTRRTAEIAGGIFGVEPAIDARLSERDFGDFELQSADHYAEVWAADAKADVTLPGRAEPIAAVAARSAELVREVEAREDLATCLLVTHCDTAMALAAVFAGVDPHHHRSFDPAGPIATGELRRLRQA